MKGAFGLKARTPLLAQSIKGTSKTPAAVEAEGRTAGNMLGQSWGLLNTRAAMEFNSKARESIYRLDIKPVTHIHDAQYFLIKDDIDVLLYLNTWLVKAVQWQEATEIYHPLVHLGGEVSVFYPDWAHEMEVPNNITGPELRELAAEYKSKLKE